MPPTTLRRLDITMPDGRCPVWLHSPGNVGPWPAVIVFMDAPGMRPALHDIAARLAAARFVVFLPDLFYRAGPYPPIDPKRVFSDPALRAEHRATVMAGATPGNVMTGTAVLLEAMIGMPEVADGPIGVVGYCMGGRLALIAAGMFSDRIAVAASFHGGGLANDAPSSPHLLARSMRARVYVGAATDDAAFPDDMRARLATALTDAGIDHRIETYPARHGWVPADTIAHDPAEAEHHWRELVPLLNDVLKPRR